MKIDGEYTFGVPRDRVWELLQDPDALSRALPGVEEFRQVGPNEYEATVRAGVAAVRGTYRGRVKMADLQPPERYTMTANGQGSAGTFDATARISLMGQDGRTQLRYEAEAQVGGPVAGVGQRMLGGVAKLMANQFFKAMEDQLAGQTGGGPGEAVVAPGATVGAPGRSSASDLGGLSAFTELLGLAGPAGPIAAAGLAGLVVGLLLRRRATAPDPRAPLANYELAAAIRDLAAAVRDQRRGLRR
jgi:uncharacterized protein